MSCPCQESSLTRRSHIIAWFVYAYFTVTVGHWWTAHSPGSMPSKRVHVPVLCSVLHWQALALPELPINGDWRLPWWIHQGWPVFPNSRLCWKSHQSSGRHFKVELTCWFLPRCRNQIKKLKKELVKCIKHKNCWNTQTNAKRNEYNTNPLDLFRNIREHKA